MKRIILNWVPPAQPNIPSPAHSILKKWLEFHGYDVSVLYWNLHFDTLQRDFVFQNIRAYDEAYNMLLYLNYIAFCDNNQSIYNEVENILKGINPTSSSFSPSFYERHMLSAYKQMDNIIDNMLSIIDQKDTLTWGFAMKMDQWLFASIIAKKIKKKHPTMPIIIGGINNKETALAYLDNFPQFDYAIWGEGESPLLELIHYLEDSKNVVLPENISNIAYRNADKVLASLKRNNQYLNMSDDLLFPDYSDFFKTRNQLHISSPINITIEGSRGCHWNRCHFCYLNTDYRYRMKSIDKIEQEIRYMISKYGVFDFQFLDNDLIGRNLSRFHKLLDAFIRVKRDYPKFQIVMAEIITKDLDYKIIRKLFLAGISFAQIGYESASSTLLKKIDKKNTFSSNLLYIKFACYHNIGVGGVNVLTGLIEESTEDIIEACSNLYFLRFFLNYKTFRHVLIPLTVNASSMYYKKINQEDSVWSLYKLLHIILRNEFSKDDQWKIFEFVRTIDNIQWDNFSKIEKFYLTNKHSYKITINNDRVFYKEFINNKNIKTLVWDTNSLEVRILYIANEKPKSFDELYSELLNCFVQEGEVLPTMDVVSDSLKRLKKEGLVYYDKSVDGEGKEVGGRFENIISVIVMFRPENT